jgi:hypothetical protein
MGPAHEACARLKTRDDHRRAAQAKRLKIRHLGAERPKRPPLLRPQVSVQTQDHR